MKVMDFGLATRLPASDDFLDAAGTSPATSCTAPRRTWHRSRFAASRPIGGRHLASASSCMNCSQERIPSPGSCHAALADPGEHFQALHNRLPSIPASVGGVVERMLTKNPPRGDPSFGDVRQICDGSRSSCPRPRSAPAINVDRPPRDGSGRLIGRDAERTSILDCMNHAASGRGGLVVLSGDAESARHNWPKKRLTLPAAVAGRRSLAAVPSRKYAVPYSLYRSARSGLATHAGRDVPAGHRV